MRSMPATEAMAMLAAGRGYLKSPAGERHSFEGFADWIVDLIRETS